MNEGRNKWVREVVEDGLNGGKKAVGGWIKKWKLDGVI